MTEHNFKPGDDVFYFSKGSGYVSRVKVPAKVHGSSEKTVLISYTDVRGNPMMKRVWVDSVERVPASKLEVG